MEKLYRYVSLLPTEISTVPVEGAYRDYLLSEEFNESVSVSPCALASSSRSSMSGSTIAEFSISSKRAWGILMNLSRSGSGKDFRAKYGITRKAATGRSKTEPFNSQIIYAPPLLREMTTSGPM